MIATIRFLKKYSDLYRPFARSMRLRHSYSLKYLAILLFLFELLVPSFWVSASMGGDPGSSDRAYTPTHPKPVTSSLFLFEENSEKQRESRDHRGPVLFLDSGFTEFLSEKPVVLSETITWDFPTKHFDTQPCLFTLNCIFLI